MIIVLLGIVTLAALGVGFAIGRRIGYTLAERDQARADLRAARVARMASDLALTRPMSLEQAERAILQAMERQPSFRPR